jgi:hypothetical protein
VAAAGHNPGHGSDRPARLGTGRSQHRLRRPGPSDPRFPPVHGSHPAGEPRLIRCFCARDEWARNAGGTPGCGTADGAAHRTRGTQTGSPPVPAWPLCQHRACGAPAQREASPGLAMLVRTRTAGTRVRTVRTGSLAPRPAPCHAAAVRAAGCPMRSCIHGKTAVCPAGTARCPGAARIVGFRGGNQNQRSAILRSRRWRGRTVLRPGRPELGHPSAQVSRS